MMKDIIAFSIFMAVALVFGFVALFAIIMLTPIKSALVVGACMFGFWGFLNWIAPDEKH